MTLNGETSEEALGRPTPFVFYDERALAVSRVHPARGPATGGTFVYVYLTDDDVLVDLGGLRCRFGGVDVAGSIRDCKKKRFCGGGGGAVVCVAPPRRLGSSQDEEVAVELSLNGQDFTSSSLVVFTYD